MGGILGGFVCPHPGPPHEGVGEVREDWLPTRGREKLEKIGCSRGGGRNKRNLAVHERAGEVRKKNMSLRAKRRNLEMLIMGMADF